MKYFQIPSEVYKIKVNVFISNNCPGDMKQFITLTINLTEKPWGCICGYCKENDTLYFHKPFINEKIDDMIYIQKEIFNKCQEYYDKLSKRIGKRGFIYLKNDETGQLMLYTRGEYTDEIINFLKTLNKGRC